MQKNLLGVIVGAFVVVIMLGSLLLPVINDVADDTKVYYNNDFGSMAAASDDKAITYVITPTGATSGKTHSATINGVEVAGIYNGIRVIILADSFTLAQSNTQKLTVSGVNDDNTIYHYTVSGELTAVIGNGSATLSFVDETTTENVRITESTSWCFYRNNNGADYKVIDFDSSDRVAYINNVNQIYGSNYINTTRGYFSFNGLNVNVYDGSGVVTSTVDYTLNDVMNGVQSMNIGHIESSQRTEGPTFVVDNDGEPYTVTPYFLVIPSSVYGQTADDVAYTSILYVLPVLLIVAVLVAIVATVRRY